MTISVFVSLIVWWPFVTARGCWSTSRFSGNSDWFNRTWRRLRTGERRLLDWTTRISVTLLSLKLRLLLQLIPDTLKILRRQYEVRAGIQRSREFTFTLDDNMVFLFDDLTPDGRGHQANRFVAIHFSLWMIHGYNLAIVLFQLKRSSLWRRFSLKKLKSEEWWWLMKANRNLVAQNTAPVCRFSLPNCKKTPVLKIQVPKRLSKLQGPFKNLTGWIWRLTKWLFWLRKSTILHRTSSTKPRQRYSLNGWRSCLTFKPKFKANCRQTLAKIGKKYLTHLIFSSRRHLTRQLGLTKVECKTFHNPFKELAKLKHFWLERKIETFCFILQVNLKDVFKFCCT